MSVNQSEAVLSDLTMFKGRKKVYAVLPYQARLIIDFMSDGVERKESEIMDKIRSEWGRDSLDRFVFLIRRTVFKIWVLGK